MRRVLHDLASGKRVPGEPTKSHDVKWFKEEEKLQLHFGGW